MLSKTVKWLKKLALYLINCAIFNTLCVYKECLHETARQWINETEKKGRTSIEDQLDDHQSTPPGLRNIHLESCQQISAGIREKLIQLMKAKGSIKPRGVKRALQTRKKASSVALRKGSCFEKYHSQKYY
jgi:hypothetical protein